MTKTLTTADKIERFLEESLLPFWPQRLTQTSTARGGTTGQSRVLWHQSNPESNWRTQEDADKSACGSVRFSEVELPKRLSGKEPLLCEACFWAGELPQSEFTRGVGEAVSAFRRGEASYDFTALQTA